MNMKGGLTMDKKQGLIEAKSLAKAKTGSSYSTFVIDGKKYNTFDKDIIDTFQIDDYVEMEGEMEGNFWNMKTMRKIDNPSGAVKAEVVKIPGIPEFHLSIEEQRCRALECAIKIWKVANTGMEVKAVIDRTDPIIEIAKRYLEFIQNGNTDNKRNED